MADLTCLDEQVGDLALDEVRAFEAAPRLGTSLLIHQAAPPQRGVTARQGVMCRIRLT